MIYKDKAKELVYMFCEHREYDTNFKDEIILAKRRALIFVDGILQEIPKRFDSEERYWEEVKNEIKNYDI
tara:strand:- start:3448 stop:3657 length:210 start_codon:yes stop_codon:yes gene_type:complete